MSRSKGTTSPMRGPSNPAIGSVWFGDDEVELLEVLEDELVGCRILSSLERSKIVR
jgi:hypothetical protein